MSFESESDLRITAKNELQNYIENKLKTDRFETLEEFPYSVGRTDIVYSRVSNKYLRRRLEELEIDNSIGKRKYLQAFLQLHRRKPVTREYFYKLGSQKKYKKKKALKWLIDNGFVEETYNSKIRSARNLRRHTTTNIAVELKLSDWKTAVNQAFRAKSYTNFQYVVLDKQKVNPAEENLELFEKRNVGLIAVSQDSFEVIREPDRSDPYSPYQTWKLNEETFKRLENYPHISYAR